MRNPAYRDIEDELLGSAFDYLVKNGLEKVSLRELCKGTGISIGSVYYWFDGKDELIIDAAEYGLMKTADAIFAYAFEHMDDLEYFFSTCLDIISQHRMEFRLIYQLTTSPQYGERMRKKAYDLDIAYDKYIQMLAERIHCSSEELTPLIHLFIAVLLDYVVWEDYKKTKLQLDYLYKQLQSILHHNVRLAM